MSFEQGKNNTRIWGAVLASIFLFVGLLLPFSVVKAQYSGSAYMIEEAQVGAVGSDNELTSGSFQARATAGDTANGIVNGTNFGAVGGFTTSQNPELEVTINTLNLDLGTASPVAALTGTSTFSVRTYLASGYVVFIQGAPPTNESGNALTAMATRTTSSVGTEQFGINLAANTSPATYGAAPAQIPDSSFSFGVVDTDYSLANNFLYINGDIIAQSNSSSGQTNYTISYLVNINRLTLAGTYIYSHTVAVVSTY